MIGERLKVARRMARLSQRGLGEKAGVSAMAISKYERGLDMPSSAVLLRLAGAVDVKTEFFLRPTEVTLSSPLYRCRVSLRQKEKQAILAHIQDWVERYLDAENLSEEKPHFSYPDFDRRVVSLDDAEKVAESLREHWGLGDGPIGSIGEMLESKGIKVGLVDAPESFDALTVWANSRDPVIAINADLPGDRQRFNLAHELGHLIMDLVGDVASEKAAYRFAGAFLVPKLMVFSELGNQRHSLDLYELHLLKHKYGLSMQAWIHRAADLGVITQSYSRQLWKQFRQKGWRTKEPGDQIAPEKPERLKRLVMRALAEDMVTRSRAAELLGKPLLQFCQEEARDHAGFPVGMRS